MLIKLLYCCSFGVSMGYGQGMVGALLLPARVGAKGRLAGLYYRWVGTAAPCPNKLSKAELRLRIRENWG